MVAVVALVAGITLWAADDDPSGRGASADDVDESLLLQASDFPIGYSAANIDRYTGSRKPGIVTPVSCRQVLMDAFRRNENAHSVSLRIDSANQGKPRYVHTVGVGGQGIDGVLTTVRSCPEYTDSGPDGQLTVSQDAFREPADCNVRATYVRYTQITDRSGDVPERTQSIAAMVEQRDVMSSVFSSGEPDAEFCRLVGRAAERLYGSDR
ncbi:hypothetical protein GCM10009624_25100 [Gordonia sinesedis]